MKDTKIHLENNQEADLFLNVEKAIKVELSGCMGKRYVVSVNDRKKSRHRLNYSIMNWSVTIFTLCHIKFDNVVSSDKMLSIAGKSDTRCVLEFD